MTSLHLSCLLLGHHRAFDRRAERQLANLPPHLSLLKWSPYRQQGQRFLPSAVLLKGHGELPSEYEPWP